MAYLLSKDKERTLGISANRKSKTSDAMIPPCRKSIEADQDMLQIPTIKKGLTCEWAIKMTLSLFPSKRCFLMRLYNSVEPSCVG